MQELTQELKSGMPDPTALSSPRRLRFKIRAASVALGILGLISSLAEFIAPYDYHTQYRESVSLPPMRIRFIDAQGRFHSRPFVYPVERVAGPGRRYVEKTDHRSSLRFFVEGETYRLLGLIEGSIHLFGTDSSEPARVHILGTDHLGRDVFSRLVYGSRVTLSIALASVVVSLLLGLLVGCLSGYWGGGTDALLMRLGELIQSVPAIFLILALRAAFPLEISFAKTLSMLVVIFSLAGWPEIARLVRSNVLSLRTRDFVSSAKAVGATDRWILRQHILPHALTPATVQATLIIPAFILGEAALSFLGVGIQEPHPSWGNMLAPAQDLTILTSAWWVLTPGIAIILTVATFDVLGDALRDQLDPRTRTRSQAWG